MVHPPPQIVHRLEEKPHDFLWVAYDALEPGNYLLTAIQNLS
jgi:hypothetical protein